MEFDSYDYLILTNTMSAIPLRLRLRNKQNQRQFQLGKCGDSHVEIEVGWRQKATLHCLSKQGMQENK
jgi:hypothetical protein